MTDSSEFDWSEMSDCIIQQEVERVAVYINPHGDLVIRQERRWDEENDLVIVVARGNVEAHIAKVREMMELSPEAAPLVTPLPAPVRRPMRSRSTNMRKPNLPHVTAKGAT